MRSLPLLALALSALTAPAVAQEVEPPTPTSVVAAAPASDWRPIDPTDLLVMDLAPDRDGKPRRVIIQLLPAPFSQGWIENIRTLANGHWWDGTSVYRVVDNWVAQWGDGEDDTAKAKPLPAGVVSPTVGYAAARVRDERTYWPGNWEEPYANHVGFRDGFPIAWNADVMWPVHCYAHVGVARDTETTGTGAELYAVIGHAPRQLDRNIAVVGRVIEGIEHLSTLPRGKGEAGVYDDPALRVPIVSVRLGNEVPEIPSASSSEATGQQTRPMFEYLASDSARFAEYVRVRANRNDAFYKVPAGGVDVCNVQVPIRRVPSE